MTPASRRFRRDRIPLTHSSVAFFGCVRVTHWYSIPTRAYAARIFPCSGLRGRSRSGHCLRVAYAPLFSDSLV